MLTRPPALTTRPLRAIRIPVDAHEIFTGRQRCTEPIFLAIPRWNPAGECEKRWIRIRRPVFNANPALKRQLRDIPLDQLCFCCLVFFCCSLILRMRPFFLKLKRAGGRSPSTIFQEFFDGMPFLHVVILV